MRRLGVASLVGALCLLLAAPLFAQRTTGGIVGVVSDSSGAVLPGVTVGVSGPTIVGTQTAVTSEKGFYRFIGLPPGTYDVSFSLTSFGDQNRKIRVSLGGMAEQNATLTIGGVTEEVVVTAEQPVVDVTSNEMAHAAERTAARSGADTSAMDGAAGVVAKWGNDAARSGRGTGDRRADACATA